MPLPVPLPLLDEEPPVPVPVPVLLPVPPDEPPPPPRSRPVGVGADAATVGRSVTEAVLLEAGDGGTDNVGVCVGGGEFVCEGESDVDEVAEGS